MILKNKRRIEGTNLITTIEFCSFGDRDMDGVITQKSIDEEKKMINRYGAPQINIGGGFVCNFEYFIPSIPTVNESKEEIKFIFYDSSLVRVDKNFKAAFSIDFSKDMDKIYSFYPSVNIDEMCKTYSINREKIAEAICQAWEKEMLNRIEKALYKVRRMKSSFCENQIGDIEMANNIFKEIVRFEEYGE